MSSRKLPIADEQRYVDPLQALSLPPAHTADVCEGYQAMAMDKQREAEALDWSEAMIGVSERTLE